MRHVFAKLTCGDISNELISINMQSACEDVGFTVINTVDHNFHPQGYTGLVLLAESHFSVHTFPEHGYMMVDCFSCNDNLDPEAAVNIFSEYCNLEYISLDVVER